MKDIDKNDVLIKIEEILYNHPQSLLDFTKNPKLLEYINDYLPYSVGIEIECNSTYSDADIKAAFEDIPDIMDISGGNGEVRFRIPNGLKGLICLYNICLELPKYFTLNMGSGNHFHVDMTEYWNLVNPKFIEDNNDWIIEELKTWGTTTDYSENNYCYCRLDYRCWCQFQSAFKTMEVRIGEMTFDYSIIAKRAIHCNEIVRKLVKQNKKEYLISIKDRLSQLNDKLTLLKEKNELNRDMEIIKNRIIKI